MLIIRKSSEWLDWGEEMADIDKWQHNLKKAYSKKIELYEKFCDELGLQLKEFLIQADIATAFPIELRVKSWESICDKCERHKITPGSLVEIDDLAGLRIILLFKRDLERTCEIIEKKFKIIKKEDASQRLANNKFGYGSIHYYIQPPSSWFNVPTLSRLKGLNAEVQLRTASQHIWAAASHILQYKREKDVPVPIRRSINRAAALLETVDLEFERVLIERGEYIQQLKEIPEDEPLNIDSLRMKLEELLPIENLDKPELYHDLLEDLRYFEIITVSELESIIKKNWDSIVQKEIEAVNGAKAAQKSKGKAYGTTDERTKKGVFYTHVGLTRKALECEAGSKKWLTYMKYIYEKRHR